MRPFAYVNPGTMGEAVGLLGRQSRALAGGTDLLPLMKADVFAPSRLVNVKRVLSDEIRQDGDALAIGALALLDSIEKDPHIRRRYRALSEAAAVSASPQLRNMATLGGNLLQRPRCWYFRNARIPCWLKGGEGCPARAGENRLHAVFGGGPCHAVHPSDPATALLALDATLRVHGITGERTIPMRDFFTLPHGNRRRENILEEDELVLSVTLPALAEGTGSAYLKAMERQAWTFALASVAVVARRSGARIEDARIVLGGVAPIPRRAEAAESVLLNDPYNDLTIEYAVAAALERAEPLAHNGYKVPLLKALVRKAIIRAAGAPL